MKDRLLYVTIGLLIALVVMQWEAGKKGVISSAQAGYVDHAATGIVAMNEAVMLDQFGKMWYVHESGWQEASTLPVPIPVSDVKFIHQSRPITTTDIAWVFSQGAWIEVGPWPGGPVGTKQESWGEIKGQYDKND